MSTWPEPYPSVFDLFETPANGCGCSACWEAEHPPTLPWWERCRVMHVCGDCGDKRCPRAGDHRNRCRRVVLAELAQEFNNPEAV